MTKKCKIEVCDDCKFFDNQYWGYNHRCMNPDRYKDEPDPGYVPDSLREITEDRDIDSPTYCRYPIPKDCPLEEY